MELFYFCYVTFQVCDNHQDCTDGSDEEHCLDVQSIDNIVLDLGFDSTSTEGIMKCIELPEKYPVVANDLVPDCSTAEDEQMFLSFLQGQSVTPSFCEDPFANPCYPGYTSKCYRRIDTCVYRTSSLGHLQPCRNGGHLKNCKRHECKTMFKCTRAYCIPFKYVCDGIKHCPRGDDESSCVPL